jgi:hypothetical protein
LFSISTPASLPDAPYLLEIPYEAVVLVMATAVEAVETGGGGGNGAAGGGVVTNGDGFGPIGTYFSVEWAACWVARV